MHLKPKKMKSLLFLIVAASISSAVFAQSTTLKVYNDDATDHSYTVTACGKTSNITLRHNHTTPTVIKGCATAVITTPAGPVSVKDGDNVYIKDGKVEVVASLWMKHIDYKND